MSEEIKYEPVFGPQELFDGAPDDVDMIGHSGGHYKNTPNGILYCGGCTFTADESRNTGFIAMRRIIKTPVWTVADQKAGRLPEVGAEVMCMDDSRHNFVGESIHAEHWALCHGKTKKVFHIPATAVRPVETDTERQQRLKEEWCHSALKLINDELTDACDAAVIYDALLSGELKAPEVE